MQSKVDKYLVVLAGPTAVGKTELAIELALRYQSVIVSADSRQIFREMSIGTAKPSMEMCSRVPHFLVDHVSLDETYSAGKYARECHSLLNQLFAQHSIVFLTGGSGLYLRAVLDGFDEIPNVDRDIKEKWKTLYAEKGLPFLQEELTMRDPQYAAEVDMHNPHRLLRALALIESSGKPFSSFRKRSKATHGFETIKILCNLPRKDLYARIDARVDEMIAQGLADEVKSLLPYRETQAMQTVGYREMIAYIDGMYTLDEAIDKIKQHTRNYAKRQLTWFRHQGDWVEFNPPDVELIDMFIRERIHTS